jgi:hypothetical protein
VEVAGDPSARDRHLGAIAQVTRRAVREPKCRALASIASPRTLKRALGRSAPIGPLAV